MIATVLYRSQIVASRTLPLRRGARIYLKAIIT